MLTRNTNGTAQGPDKQADDHPLGRIERFDLLRDLVPVGEDATADELDGEFPARREKRERVFRVAEYSPYPRVGRDQRRLNAFCPKRIGLRNVPGERPE